VPITIKLNPKRSVFLANHLSLNCEIFYKLAPNFQDPIFLELKAIQKMCCMFTAD